MRKLRAAAVLRSVAGRVLHPRHLAAAFRLQRGRKKSKRAHDDAQLALLAQLVPGGFLHYGYFDDPGRRPEAVSLSEMAAAQERYAELLLEHATDRSAPALDVGCGMGGLTRLLLARGFSPVALTPDWLQAEHVRRSFPDVPVIRSRFEDLPDPDAHAGRYGTVFTSESMHFLKLDPALPLLAKLLKPGGTWIACDYFRRGDAGGETDAPHRAGGDARGARGGGKSGHEWDAFRRRLDTEGWIVTYERDITPHVLPTLRAAHLWATRLGVPLLQFARLKLCTKQPAVHYVLEDAMAMLDGVIEDNLQLVDPDVFTARKRYVLLVARRPG